MKAAELIITLGVLIMAISTVWLLFSNRRMKREIRMVLANASGQPILEAPAAPSPEVEELRKRVQVLERIATDGNVTLDREIERLRQA